MVVEIGARRDGPGETSRADAVSETSHQHTRSGGAAAPRFSIVVPTYRRRDVVTASVRALTRQEGAAPFEVIVVVDGSDDGSAEALRALRVPFPLSVVEQPNRGRAAACNRGAAAAAGELLLLLDDDMEADPRLLAEHERSHAEGADVVLGHIPLHPDSPPGFLADAVGRWAERRAALLESSGGPPPLEELLTGQMSLRRETFARLGGFDDAFTRGGAFGGEDLDLGRRLSAAGCAIVFNPKAVSRQRYVVRPRQYLRQWREAGRSDVLLARKHPQETERIFRRRLSASERIVWRRLRLPLRWAVLALASVGPQGPRTTRWFYRVRDLEYHRGARAAGGIPGPGPVRVLCYHSISDLSEGGVLEPYGIPAGRFRRQLGLLQRHFHVIGPDEFRRFLAGAGVPRRAVLLTFDDCYEDLLESGLPLLRARGLPAVAFAVTRRLGATNDWDAHLGAPQIRLLDAAGLSRLAAGGVEVGSHSRTHRMLSRVPPGELPGEAGGSAADLEAAGLGRPAFFAYPHGEHDAAARRAVADAGYRAAFTVEPGLAWAGGDPYAIPRIEILRRDSAWRFLAKVLRQGRSVGQTGRRA
jgi:GT2 family glycosyltransferase/peptidoglycan/xylan/chitin deacetylase (PgdA/CDA1 family)